MQSYQPNKSLHMTPQEQAKKLITQFEILAHPLIDMDIQMAKQCSLIAVDKIIDCTRNGFGRTKFSKQYWQEVKQEIENL